MDDNLQNTLHIAFVWLHILGIALFLGPQFFLAFAWVPASRGIADTPTRLQTMRTVTRRFGYLAGAGLVLIIVAGSYLISDWRDWWNVPDDVGFTELRYGVIFIVKMLVLLVVLALVGLHSFVLGPRLIDLLEEQAAGRATDAEVRQARMWSMAASISTMVLTIALIALGVTLSTGQYSLREF